MKDLSERLLRPAVALDLQEILEGRLVLQAGRSAHLPEEVPFLAQTATGAAVLSHAAVVGVARGASLGVALATVAATSVAEVVDNHQSQLTKTGIARSSFFSAPCPMMRIATGYHFQWTFKLKLESTSNNKA